VVQLFLFTWMIFYKSVHGNCCSSLVRKMTSHRNDAELKNGAQKKNDLCGIILVCSMQPETPLHLH